MSEFYTVRHGQASFGAANYDKLSELGWQQARWLGEHWRQSGVQFERVIGGDLQRHQETAGAICEGLQLSSAKVELFPQLNEFDFNSVMQAYGDMNPHDVPAEGSARTDYYRFLKKAMHAWSAEEIVAKESWHQFEQRIEEVLGLIAQSTAKGCKTLVVSSGGAIAMMVRQILGAQSQTVTQLNMQIKNTAISRFYVSRNGISLHSFNHVPHLETSERREFITYS